MELKIDSEELYNVLDAASSYNDEGIAHMKGGGILMRIQDKSKTGLYNTLIPEDAFDTYELGERPKIGLDIEELKSIVPSKSQELYITNDGHKLRLTIGSRDYYARTIDIESISSDPELTPDLQMPVKVVFDPSKLTDFINEAHSYVFKKDSGHLYMQVQEGQLHMWSNHDVRQLYEHFHWEDFEDYDINWQDATASDKIDGNPSEDKRITTLLSTMLTKDIKLFSEKARMEIGHGMPLKMVSESDAGIKHSWIVPPRFPGTDDRHHIPQKVIREREVL